MKYNVSQHSSIGNKARTEKLAPEQRKAIASTAAKVRWEQHRLRKEHVCGFSCKCFVCDRRLDKGAHTKYSENPHEFICSISKVKKII